MKKRVLKLAQLIERDVARRRHHHPSDLLCDVEHAIVLRQVAAGRDPAEALAEVDALVAYACDNGLAALHVLHRYKVKHHLGEWVPR